MRIINVKLDEVNLHDTIDIISSWIVNKSPNYICHVPAHAIMSCYEAPELLDIYNSSGLNVPDGMSIVWIMKMAGYKNVDRVYGPDLLLKMCENGLANGIRHYFYGGSPQALEKMIQNIRNMFPGINIVGYNSPPFRELKDYEQEELNAQIIKSNADIVWVGLGSPKQEAWMKQNIKRINGPVMIGVGAAFDFISGNKPQAPKLIQKIGMEWLFRWFSEPRRLFKRYIINYPRFVGLVLIESIKKKLAK